MPTSVLSIDIDDDQFKEFLALYSKYEDSVKKLPGSWGNVNKATEANAVTVEDLAAALLTQNHLLRDSFDSQKAIAKEVARVDRAYDAMGKKIESMHKNAVRMTAELAKWGFAITGIATATMFGSLFGVDRLGSSAAQISRSARGLGVDPAAQQAFGVNFGRYVDPNSMLSNTAELQADQSRWGAFMAAGIGTGKVQSEDPEQLSREVITQAKRLWDEAGPNNHTLQYMQAHGLDQLLPGGLQDWKRIGGASRDDLDRAQLDTERDRNAFALDPKALKEWTDFTSQMHRAGTTMEDVLIGKLAPLAGPLTDLSAAFTHAVGQLLASPDLGSWIESLGHGIESFATYLTSPAFAADLATAETDFHKFTKAMGELLTWSERALTRLGIISDPDAAPTDGTQAPGYPAGGGPDWPTGPKAQPYRNSPIQSDGQPSSWFTRWMYPNGFGGHAKSPFETATPPDMSHYWWDPWHPGGKASSSEIETNKAESWAFWKSKGYSDEAAAAELGNEAGESGFDPYARGDSNTAGGIEQWHKDRRDAILAKTGIDVWTASHADQLKAAWAERQGLDAQATAAQPGIQSATSIDSAIGGLVNGVERPRDRAGAIATRSRLAEEALRRFGGHDAKAGVDAGLVQHGIKAAPGSANDPAPGLSGKALVDVLKKMSQRANAGGNRVVIENRTGGDAVVSASQLAYG